MGVTGLWKLIDQSGKPVPLETLENKVLAVDISIWLHQVVKGFQDSNGATLQNAHLLGLFHRLCKLMFYRIKPVFVFDGGVPPLKRETIAKRARNKTKYQTEADKLQHLLLEALAKEKVVQQALGPASALLTKGSPKKAIRSDDDDNDLFKLPPIQESELEDDSQTDLSESDSSFDAKHRNVYNHNLQSIDVKSSHFQSLPADVRHEILSDIKETRKQSSWGRLHELPAESQSFSVFQMNRLLKRRQVQVELEEAEKEMGGKGLSMAELENLLSEEGVVDPDIATERIASNEHVRYLHVRDITKALKKDADEKVKIEKDKLDLIEIEQEVNNEVKIEQLKEIVKTEELTEEDYDLQRAIQMSLGVEINNTESNENSESESLRLTVEQKKALGLTTNSLARHYMVEYGGLNDEEVSDLVKMNDSVNITQEFKYNDDIIIGKNVTEIKPSTSKSETTTMSELSETTSSKSIVTETINISESSSDNEVSSDADSDFIDVPEMDDDNDDKLFDGQNKLPLPPPFLMNEPPKLDQPFDFTQLKSDETKFEVVINPGQLCADDIFADIFENSFEETIEKGLTPVMNKINIQQCDKNDAEICLDKKEKPIPEATVSEKSEPNSDHEATAEKQQDEGSKKNPSTDSKIKNILAELDDAKSAVTKLSLNDLLGTKSIEISPEKQKTQDILEELNASSSTETTPKKIPQPFFVKKTPPSSKKKSPASDKHINELTPSKAAKSLLEAFDCVPSTSKVNEQESVAMAANVLRENKSKQELENIAEQLNQERQNLAAERNKKDRLGVSITEQMSMECMELLRLFGVPYIVAPMEAEAQCAYLNEINLTDGTITDDSDIWLFGGQTVYKNFFDQRKHVLEFRSDNIQRLFHLDRHKLIQLSFLVGSDYTQGIHGIGAVTALEVLSFFTATPEKEGETTRTVSILSSLRKFRDWWQNKSVAQKASTLRNKLKNIILTEDFPNIQVVEAYLFPTVDENREKFTWGHPEVETLREYAKKTFGWTNKRTDEIVLPVVKRLGEKKSQQSIQNYFKITGVTSRQDLKVSKRVRTALQQMSGDPDSSIEVIEKKKSRKKPTKSKATSSQSKEIAVDEQEDAGMKSKTSKPQSKPRAPRKRKATFTDPEQQEHLIEPSTSASGNVAVGGKKVVLPDRNAPIPQREQDKLTMESNRLKAIEVLKKGRDKKK